MRPALNKNTRLLQKGEADFILRRSILFLLLLTSNYHHGRASRNPMGSKELGDRGGKGVLTQLRNQRSSFNDGVC